MTCYPVYIPTLNRVKATSRNGRAITNRIGYLLAAMKRQTSSQQE